MLWYNYLYENTMFTNKWDVALRNAWEMGQGRERVA